MYCLCCFFCVFQKLQSTLNTLPDAIPAASLNRVSRLVIDNPSDKVRCTLP